MTISCCGLGDHTGEKCRCYCPRVDPGNRDTEDMGVVRDREEHPGLSWAGIHPPPRARRSQETWTLTIDQIAEPTLVLPKKSKCERK